jgi:cytoskeletal protein RodZ
VESKKNIDQLFKDGLSEPDIPFNEQDWEIMARKLDEQSRRKRWKTWLLWSSAAAAVFLVVLFWMFAGPTTKMRKDPDKGIAKTRQGSTPPDSNAKGAAPGVENNESASKAHLIDQDRSLATNLPERPAASVEVPGRAGEGYAAAMLNPTGMADIRLHTAETANIEAKTLPDLSLTQPVAATVSSGEQYVGLEKRADKKVKRSPGSGKQFVLSAIVAPDLSYAKSAVGSKVSSNFGLLATYAFHPRLSVTTGAVYANKYYNSRGAGAVNYGADEHTLQINARCNVIDIPVNLNYKLLSKKAFSVSLNTGLSSYIMLKEKYDYVYSETGYAESTVSMEIRNENRHMFGVANVAVSFDRQISPQISIGVQPFMKVPLTGIGYGKADLKSTGVSFSVNMGLFPGKKAAKTAVWSRLNR